MKKQQVYKGVINTQGWWIDEFEHRYACWAQNHNNWAKVKKLQKRMAKHRMNQIEKKQIEQDMLEDDDK